MKRDFNEICACLDKAIQNANGKLPLKTRIGTSVNLEKQTNGNYKITFNTDKETYESITKDNLYKFLFENWRGNPSLGRDDSRLSLFEAIEDFIETNCKNISKEEKKFIMSDNIKQPLNQILFGPPGTGKTFNTINKALEIIDNDFFQQNKDDRTALKDKFEEYKKAGQIEFVTFHQSYGYEEFVEGIKAISSDDERNPTDDLIYKVEHGIFKQLCKNAENKEYMIDDLSIDDNSSIWKISLGSTYGNEIKTKCFNDNEIRIGWTDVQEVGDDNFNKLGSNNQSTIKNFIEDMEIGDLVISIYNQNKIDGIGIIESEYKLDDDEHYNKFRKVKWLSKDILDLTQLNGNKVFVQKTVYKINRFKPKDLLSFIKQNEIQVKSDNINKNYILIIDEINRGNISKIFGELITLIEPSKRIGAKEGIKVKLPYSNDEFGVPQNLYILGTMNTADRSIALMDTALRRRFEFIEMLPDLAVLSNNDEKVEDSNSDKSQDNDLIVNDINIRLLLQKINQRIEYLYDRDHTIGHAYFMSLKDNPTIDELEKIFRNKIIPLLQEYFYDDWEKILMVLGNGFIEKNSIKDDIFDYKVDEYLEEEKSVYKIKDKFDFSSFK